MSQAGLEDAGTHKDSEREVCVLQAGFSLHDTLRIEIVGLVSNWARLVLASDWLA